MTKTDKQYWALSAIYRMTRRNRWSQTRAAWLLETRAKYRHRDAEAIASLWFRYPFKHHAA